MEADENMLANYGDGDWVKYSEVLSHVLTWILSSKCAYSAQYSIWKLNRKKQKTEAIKDKTKQQQQKNKTSVRVISI